MSHQLNKFYLDQAGSGIDIFSGYDHNQKGSGFFGRFYSNSIKPILTSFMPVVRDTALHGASKVAQHLTNEIRAVKRKRKSGKRIKQSKKRNQKKKKTTSNYF